MIHNHKDDQCPRCKSEKYFDAYYDRIRENHCYCYDCGYEKILWFKRDRSGHFIKKDKTKKMSWENLIPEEILTENPFGAFKIKYLNGNGEMGNIITVNDYTEFVAEVKRKTKKEHNIKNVFVSRLSGGKIVRESIY